MAAKGAATGKSPTENQLKELERLRLEFVKAQQTGSADLDPAREAYQTYAADILVDLSGKTEIPPGPDVLPLEGYVKPGGWGANSDPKTWKVAPMKNPPSDFKVVDDKAVNVAVNFHSVASANMYITAHQTQPTTDCLPGFHKDGAGNCVPDSAPPTGNADQFGVIMIKKSAPSGKVETNFKLEEKMRNYASGKASEWSTEYTNVSPAVIQNQEVTIYEKINGFKSEPDTISLKLGGPDHQNKARFWCIPDFETDGSAKKTMEIEDPHPTNKGINPKPLTSIGGTLVGKWFGYKGISYQMKNGKRRVESWIHYPVDNIDAIAAEQSEWRQYITYDTDPKYLTFLGKNTTSRLDGVTKGDPPNFKYASVREILAD